MEYAAELHRRCAGVARAGAAGSNVRSWNPNELAMHAMAVEFPLVHGHPNRLPFEGVLTLVDVAEVRHHHICRVERRATDGGGICLWKRLSRD